MQARDVRTREVVPVGPETSAEHAAEVVAENDLATPPLVDGVRRVDGADRYRPVTAGALG